MKRLEDLIVIYGDKSNFDSSELDVNDQNFKKTKKYIFSIFGDAGVVDIDSCEKIYSEMYLKDNKGQGVQIGPFENINELRQFSFALLEELNGDRLTFIDCEAYNKVIEEVNNAFEVIPELIKVGDSLKNPNANQDKGIFNKIFN